MTADAKWEPDEYVYHGDFEGTFYCCADCGSQYIKRERFLPDYQATFGRGKAFTCEDCGYKFLVIPGRGD